MLERSAAEDEETVESEERRGGAESLFWLSPARDRAWNAGVRHPSVRQLPPGAWRERPQWREAGLFPVASSPPAHKQGGKGATSPVKQHRDRNREGARASWQSIVEKFRSGCMFVEAACTRPGDAERPSAAAQHVRIIDSAAGGVAWDEFCIASQHISDADAVRFSPPISASRASRASLASDARTAHSATRSSSTLGRQPAATGEDLPECRDISNSFSTPARRRKGALAASKPARTSPSADIRSLWGSAEAAAQRATAGKLLSASTSQLDTGKRTNNAQGGSTKDVDRLQEELRVALGQVKTLRAALHNEMLQRRGLLNGLEQVGLGTISPLQPGVPLAVAARPASAGDESLSRVLQDRLASSADAGTSGAGGWQEVKAAVAALQRDNLLLEGRLQLAVRERDALLERTSSQECGPAAGKEGRTSPEQRQSIGSGDAEAGRTAALDCALQDAKEMSARSAELLRRRTAESEHLNHANEELAAKLEEAEEMLLEQTAMLASVTRRFEGQMAEAREKLHWHVEAQGQLQEAEEKLTALQGQAESAHRHSDRILRSLLKSLQVAEEDPKGLSAEARLSSLMQTVQLHIAQHAAMRNGDVMRNVMSPSPRRLGDVACGVTSPVLRTTLSSRVRDLQDAPHEPLKCADVADHITPDVTPDCFRDGAWVSLDTLSPAPSPTSTVAPTRGLHQHGGGSHNASPATSDGGSALSFYRGL